MWQWIPTDPETENDYAGEDQQQISDMFREK
jgi:hypothetical protein